MTTTYSCLRAGPPARSLARSLSIILIFLLLAGPIRKTQRVYLTIGPANFDQWNEARSLLFKVATGPITLSGATDPRSNGLDVIGSGISTGPMALFQDRYRLYIQSV